MANGTYYEYIILYHPRQTQERGEHPKSEIVSDRKGMVATDDKAVAIMAAREIPEKYLNELDCIEIIVRPFA